MQPLQNCIGPTIRIGREILCLPYAGFKKKIIKNAVNFLMTYHEPTNIFRAFTGTTKYNFV